MVAEMTPKPMQTHWSAPAIYMTTKTMNTASSPAAKMNRYCAFKPLNSTLFPIPLLILNSILQEERAKDSCRHDEKYAGSEPTGCGFRSVGIAGAELVVDLDAADQAHDCPNRVDEFCSGVEVGGYHIGGFGNTRLAVTLCKSG